MNVSDRVLVTGAAGYLGQYLVRELRDAGCDVMGVVRPGRQHDHPAAACELTDRASVSALIATTNPTVIVHAAAWIGSGPATTATVAAAVANNVTATANLVSACAGSNVRRFMFCSSVEVYAPTPANGIAHQEGDTLAPLSLYGRTKAAAEFVVQSLRGIEIDARVFRMPGLHGAPRTSGVVYRLINATQTGSAIEIDEPETRLSLLWCRDAARCIAAGATGILKGQDPTINIANGDVTLISLADTIGRATGRQLDARRGARGARNRVLDLTRMRAVLPFAMPAFEEQLANLAQGHAVA